RGLACQGVERSAVFQRRSFVGVTQPAWAFRLVFNQFVWKLVQETRRFRRQLFSINAPLHGVGQVQILFGTRDGDIAEAAFFFQLRRVIAGARMREEVLFQ